MRKFLALTVVTFFALVGFVCAGPEAISGKEMKQVVPPPCPEWYGAHEVTLSIWGAFAFPADDGRGDIDEIGAEHEANENDHNDDHEDNIAPLSHDHFLNTDGAFGGGMDLKYFFSKYVGIGLEGYILDAESTAGGVLGTVTFRYPIGCSRWAPYAFAGIGAAFGGSRDVVAEIEELELFYSREIDDDGAAFDGQIGAGLEFRVTRHIGIMGDFSWHFLGRKDSDFGMVRSGITFGF